MATKEEIQQLLDAIKGALSAKFDENDKRFTTLINGLELDAIFCARVKIFNAQSGSLVHAPSSTSTYCAYLGKLRKEISRIPIVIRKVRWKATF
jgi:hypothetical protein